MEPNNTIVFHVQEQDVFVIQTIHVMLVPLAIISILILVQILMHVVIVNI